MTRHRRAPLDLGAVQLGASSTVALTVRSVSTMNAWLDSYELTAASAVGQVGVATGTGPIAPGMEQSYSVTFEPTQVGSLECDLHLRFSDRVSPPRYSQQLTLRVVGVGIGAQAEFSPDSLDFGEVVLGSQSAALPMILRNVGQLPLGVSGSLIGQDFRLASPMPTLVAPGAEEEMSIVFRPGHGGFRSSAFSVSSNSARPPLPASLQGIGLVEALLEVTPTVLAYAPTPVGSMSEEQLVVTNAGGIPVQVGAVRCAGPDAADFVVREAGQFVGLVLHPEQTCDIGVAFKPDAPGAKSATLELAHDGTSSPMVASLEGRAIEVLTLTPNVTELDFGSIEIEIMSRKQTVLMTNATDAKVTIDDILVDGPAGEDFVVSDNDTSRDLRPGVTYKVDVSLRPSALGVREGTLIVVAAERAPLWHCTLSASRSARIGARQRSSSVRARLAPPRSGRTCTSATLVPSPSSSCGSM